MAKRMTDSNLRKLGQALSKLRAQGMVMESQDERKQRVVNYLLKNQKNRLRGAFYKLTLFKNLKNAKENDEKRSQRGRRLQSEKKLAVYFEGLRAFP